MLILSDITSWLLSKGLEKYRDVRDENDQNRNIDDRLKEFKDAYNEAFTTKEITPEQRARLRKSIAHFIRGDDGGL